MDQLGLVQPVDRLGQRVVVAVALAADRGFDARFGQPLGVADAGVLGPRSEWQMRVPSRSGCLAYKACSRAFRTKSVRMGLLTRRPTMRRAKTSITKAA